MDQKKQLAVLRRLTLLEQTTPGCYWPMQSVLLDLKIREDPSVVALDLEQLGYVKLQGEPPYCALVTDTGRQEVEASF